MAHDCKFSRFFWEATDALKAHLGPFADWPEPLKEAFSNCVIADDQTLTPEEIAWAQRELAKE
jgi:hypothetical protein